MINKKVMRNIFNIQEHIFYRNVVSKLFSQTLNNFKALFPVDKSIPSNITTLNLTYLIMQLLSFHLHLEITE